MKRTLTSDERRLLREAVRFEIGGGPCDGLDEAERAQAVAAVELLSACIAVLDDVGWDDADDGLGCCLTVAPEQLVFMAECLARTAREVLADGGSPEQRKDWALLRLAGELGAEGAS